MIRHLEVGAGVWVFAESPKVEPEPDFGSALPGIVRGAFALDSEKAITAADRVTPVDRWFGWDGRIIDRRDEDDPFVDSSDVASYVTVTLEKPFGIEILENPEEEGGGVLVGEVRPGFAAFDSPVESGYHLIIVDDTPVYGLPFEDVIKPIMDKEGPVRLTFFKGDAVYFYGEFRPSAQWLAQFIDSIKAMPLDTEEQ